jgi:response regulator of citrate/malate metabolism
MPNRFKTILVEDDMVARMILENYCTNHPSIRFLKDFDDIEDAISFVKNNPVDLVFLDIQLRNSSGFDLLQHLPASTQVIITTSDSGNIEKAHRYKIDNVLIKPITLEAFLWSVKKLSSLPI